MADDVLYQIVFVFLLGLHYLSNTGLHCFSKKNVMHAGLFLFLYLISKVDFKLMIYSIFLCTTTVSPKRDHHLNLKMTVDSG